MRRRPLVGDTEFSVLVTGEVSQPQGYSVEGRKWGQSLLRLPPVTRLREGAELVSGHQATCPGPPGPPPLQELALNQAVLCEACPWPVILHLDPPLVSLASKCRVPFASFQQRNVLGGGPRYLARFRMRKLPGGVVSCLPRAAVGTDTPFGDLWACS